MNSTLNKLICWLRDCEYRAVAWSKEWIMKECKRCKDKFKKDSE